MTISKILFSLSLSLLMFHSSAQAKANGSYFVFSKEKDHYSVEVKGAKKILLKPVGRDGLLRPIGPVKLPLDVEYKVQLSYLLSEKEVDKRNVGEVYSLLNRTYPTIKDVHLFTELSKNICFNKQDEQCLQELMTWIYANIKDPAEQKTQRASIYLLRARLNPDWTKQRDFFEKALKELPNDPEIKYYAQIFSVEIALQVVGYYKSEIETNGLNAAIGFSTAMDGKFDYRDALIEAVANTYNLGRLITSHYFNDPFAQDIADRWIKSLEQLREAETNLNKIKKALINVSDVRLSSKAIVDILPRNQLAKPFYLSIVKNGLYQTTQDKREVLLFPNIHQFQIAHVDEFSNPNLKQVLKQQVNFLNFFMLVRGPAVVQAFGKTKLGVMLVDKLRLKPLVNSMSKLRWPLNSLTVWVALETADGCLIRYAYVFYTVGDQISGDSLNEIKTILNSKGYATK